MTRPPRPLHGFAAFVYALARTLHGLTDAQARRLVRDLSRASLTP